MDKKQLHYLLTKVRRIKVWHLVALFAVFTTVAVFALRANNLQMVKLRGAVYAADKDNGDIEGALQRLRIYVYGHMNTKLGGGDNPVYPPIQLKYTYQRLQDAENQKAQSSSAVYADAQKYCEQQNSTDFSGRNRVPCIEQYVAEHPAAKPRTIPDALYKFDFVSPSWSPDLAGFAVLLAALSGLLVMIRLGAGYVLQRLAH